MRASPACRLIASLSMYPADYVAPTRLETSSFECRRRSCSGGVCTDYDRLRQASGIILVATIIVTILVGEVATSKVRGHGRISVLPAQTVVESLYLLLCVTGVSGLGSTVLIGTRANGEIELVRELPGACQSVRDSAIGDHPLGNHLCNGDSGLWIFKGRCNP
ncbi:hypothetical protein GGR58DRAFT_56217 [Xylaria digitata]|nr:hypothetical protein GGR58DRAFT_56217 [Xylaria digitata]